VKAVWGLALGIACAIAIACGGSKSSMKSAAPAPPTAVQESGGLPGSPRDEIDQLDRDIAAKLEQMQLAPPPAAPMPAGMSTQAMSAEATSAANDTSTCAHGTSDTCRSSCDLSKSICDNAGRICNIANQLGNDNYANQKCASGKASCDAAHGRCCSCQP